MPDAKSGVAVRSHYGTKYGLTLLRTATGFPSFILLLWVLLLFLVVVLVIGNRGFCRGEQVVQLLLLRVPCVCGDRVGRQQRARMDASYHADTVGLGIKSKSRGNG